MTGWLVGCGRSTVAGWFPRSPYEAEKKINNIICTKRSICRLSSVHRHFMGTAHKETESNENNKKETAAAAATTTIRAASVSILNYIYIYMYFNWSLAPLMLLEKNKSVAIQRITLFDLTAFSDGDWVRSALFCAVRFGSAMRYVHRAHERLGKLSTRCTGGQKRKKMTLKRKK